MDLTEAVRFERQGRLVEAERACRRALELPGRRDAGLRLLGTVVLRLGRPREAVTLLEDAARLSPVDPYLRVELAAALGESARPNEALSQLAQALQIKGDIPELHNNLGVTLERLGRVNEAAAAYRNAVRLRADYPAAWINMGNALRRLGRLVDAVAAYEQAAKLRPDDVAPLHQLAATLPELADLAGTIDCLRRLIGLAPSLASARSALLYTLHYAAAQNPETLWREHREWGRRFCAPTRQNTAAHVNHRDPHPRLRVGYVSPDFREQTVPYFIAAAFRHHDPTEFEIFCYSDVATPDAVTHRLRGMVEQWRETRPLKDSDLDHLIRQDSIDILVDLRGHATENRLTLFARRPAPVQATMVGYFNTTGLSEHFRITDEHMDPPGQTESYHTETLVRLPGSCWCYTADEDAPDVSEPPAMKNGYVTFGSLNKIIKVSEPCAKLWAGVLEAVPGSKLLLSVAAADAGGVVRNRLESYGLPSDRLVIVDKTRGRREYVSRFGQIDVALDTWPFNGITTTCDGLWMGVPCVSMTGGTSVSRAGKSILHAAGLGELATESPEAFIQAATGLACDTERLRELRRSMRDRLLASTLMDHRGLARKLEAAYQEMWRAWCHSSEDFAARRSTR